MRRLLPFGARPRKAGDRPGPTQDEIRILDDSRVPTVSLAEARQRVAADCADECDEPCSTEDGIHYVDGFDESNSVFNKLDLDYDSHLLGSIKTNGRTVIVATSKSDWPHSVTDESGLYAHTISKAYDSHLKHLPAPSGPSVSAKSRHCVEKLNGFGDGLNKDGTERLHNLTILCGSQRTLECEDDPIDEEAESVLVFPDYKLVANLPKSSAKGLVAEHLSPHNLGPIYTPLSKPNGNHAASNEPSASLQSFILPYYAVILVCSHKRRDKRCHITADPLINALRDAIEAKGHDWSVDTRADDFHAFEPYRITPSTDVSTTLRTLSSADPSTDKQVGIFKTSHVGGHKYAGQLIIFFPNGINVWYGRVREADCRVIVEETLMKGNVVRELLRGGTGIAGRSSVLEW